MIPSKVVDKLIIIEIIAVEFPTVYITVPFFFFFKTIFYLFYRRPTPTSQGRIHFVSVLR